jgi:hypothetical protein
MANGFYGIGVERWERADYSDRETHSEHGGCDLQKDRELEHADAVKQ